MTDSLSSELALSIIENCNFPLLVVDRNGSAVTCNRAFERLVGRAQADELLECAYSDLLNHPLRLLLTSEHTLCWTDQNGEQHPFEIHSIELNDERHCQARLFIDISRQMELERELEAVTTELKQHVLTDDATGLLNERGIMLALEPQVARSRRYNSPISVVMMDVRLGGNREHTHLDIARLLKDQLRWADLIGFTSNGEFILALPETTPEAALRLAGKLKQKLIEMSGQNTDGENLEACYGVTGWRRSDNAATLLQRAGVALSRARSEQGEHLIAL